MPDIDINFSLVKFHLMQLTIAFILAIPLAINREKNTNSAGLRTFPLVSISCCAFMLVGIDVFEDSEAQARIMYGIMTGIGFIGGGSILKNEDSVKGTATAAGIWLTAAVGVGVAFQRYEISLLLSFVGFTVLYILQKSKSKLS